MLWIGLTGGIATGKSTVARLLKSLGYPVIDADEIAHRALVQGSPVLDQVVKIFGNKILKDGSVDRKVLGQLVFKNPEQLLKLEQIVHPFVQDQVKKEREKLKKHDMAFYDVPLLFEKKLEKQFDAIIVVASSQEKQIERMRNRNKFSDVEIQNRLQNQIPIGEKIKKTKFIIWNNGSEEELKKELNKLIKTLPRP